MSMRLRRLQADYEKICSFFTGNSRIKLVKAIGNPPEKYQFEYLVSGLEMDINTNSLKRRNNFNVEIVLTSAYPRMAPQCKMLTPVFHPNIAPHAICIGDHWAAGESLSHLIVRIAEMISFQSYNVKSPLNGEAAKWCKHSEAKLPIDGYDFQALLSIGEKSGASRKNATICVNCGKAPSPDAKPFTECLNGHIACEDCSLVCERCNSILCLKCQVFTCITCSKTICYQCVYKCLSCKQLVCLDHKEACYVCGKNFCGDCMVTCEECGKRACINDIARIKEGDIQKYLCYNCNLDRNP